MASLFKEASMCQMCEICMKGYRRLPITLIKLERSPRRVKELIKELYDENELNTPYHAVNSNCKTFAKRVYSFVSRDTHLHWYDGAFS